MDLSTSYSSLTASLMDTGTTEITPLPLPSPSLPGDLVPLGFILTAWSFGSDEALRRWSSFIGIVIAICGNILISLALNIQKYAHIRLERESENRRRIWRRRRRWLRSQETGASTSDESSSSGSSTPIPGTPPDESTGLLAPQDQPEKDTPPPQDQQYLSSPYWWIGFVLMSVGECGNFLAYGFAPASIVSPLGVVALVSNCVIAPVILKEPLRRRDIIGVIVSILGAVVVVWSAEKEETKLGPDQILEAISQTAFEVYFGITCAMIIVLMYLSSKYGRRTILIDLGLVALFGGYTVLSTKGISSLLSSSFYHIFTYPIAYLFTFVLLFTAVLQIKYVNRALQRFDSTQVIPTQFVLFTISVILGSAILYRDFETVKPERMVKFCTGCALTFWGVWLISSRRKDRKWDCDDEDDGDLEGYGAAGPRTGSIDLCRQDGDIRGGKRPRVDSIGFENGVIQGDGASTPTPSSPMKVGSTRPMIVRGISSSSIAILDSFPTTPNSRSNSYIPISPSVRPLSRLASEPILPTQDTPHNSLSRRASRSSAAGGGMHRKSISNLLPGPLVAGYQLKAVMSDFGGTIRTRRNSEVETGLLEEAAFLQEAGGRDGGEGRRRSGSLGVVLDLLKRKGRKGLGEEESDTEG